MTKSTMTIIGKIDCEGSRLPQKDWIWLKGRQPVTPHNKITWTFPTHTWSRVFKTVYWRQNKIQVKTKDGSIDNKSQVYFQISEKDFDSFDEFLGIRILTRDRNKGIINKLEIRHIGPIPKDILMQKVRGKGYFLNDIMDLGYEEIIGYIEK